MDGHRRRAFSGTRRRELDPEHVRRDEQEPSLGRRIGALGALGGVYAGMTVWAYFAWYHNVPDLGAFEYGGDGYFEANTYAGGADKVGHGWATYTLARGTTELLRYGGWKPVSSSLIASSLALGFFTFVEFKDAYYYQFSPGDQIANTLGSMLALVLSLSPRADELFDFRVEYYPSTEYRRALSEDGDVDIAEDYSGQRYLAALHVGALPGLRARSSLRWLKLVDVAVGFETKLYKPEPPDPDAVVPTQHLFLGVSFNAQAALDWLLDGASSRPARAGRALGHGLFEVMNPPFTSLAVVGPTRYCPAPCGPDPAH
jgi:hypothetical protein